MANVRIQSDDERLYLYITMIGKVDILINKAGIGYDNLIR